MSFPQVHVDGEVWDGAAVTSLEARAAAFAADTVVPLGSISGSVTCDISQGVCFTGTQVGACTFHFTNWPAGNVLIEPLLVLTQDGSGGRAITVSGVTWLPAGTPPTFDTTAGAINVVSLSSPDQGVTIYGADAAGASAATTTPSLTFIDPALSVDTPFIIGPRTGGLTFPVPTLQPTVAAKVIALDIAPSAGATASPLNGMAWIDVCNVPVKDANPYVGTSMRIGNGSTMTTGSKLVADLSTRKFGAVTARPLVLAADWDGARDPQIYMEPQTTGLAYVKLGMDGSDVIQGKPTALATNATLGFLFVATMAGTPSGTPTHASAAATALVYDSTGHKLWVYDQPAGAWKGVVVA